VTITDVNDAPTLLHISKEGEEDTPVPFTTTDFEAGFQDVDGDTLVSIRITTLPSHGKLFKEGVAVATGEDIPAVEI